MTTNDTNTGFLVPIGEVHWHRPQYAHRARLLRRLREERRVRTAVLGRRVYVDLYDLDRWEGEQIAEATSSADPSYR